MKNERFFDQILEMIERGNTAQAMMLLTGKLYNAVEDSKSWPQTRADLRQHTPQQLASPSRNSVPRTSQP